MNPPEYLGLPKTDSIVDWIPDTPISHYRFEFPAYGKLYKTTMPTISKIDSIKLISYDRIMAPQSIARAMAEYVLSKSSEWSEKAFYFPSEPTFDAYNRYAIIEGFFEGYTLKKTQQEILFGFTSHP